MSKKKGRPVGTIKENIERVNRFVNFKLKGDFLIFIKKKILEEGFTSINLFLRKKIFDEELIRKEENYISNWREINQLNKKGDFPICKQIFFVTKASLFEKREKELQTLGWNDMKEYICFILENLKKIGN